MPSEIRAAGIALFEQMSNKDKMEFVLDVLLTARSHEMVLRTRQTNKYIYPDTVFVVWTPDYVEEQMDDN